MNKRTNLFKKIIATFLTAAILLECPQFFEQADNSSVSTYSLEKPGADKLPRH